MPPIWEPSEERSTLYEKAQQHSEGMISFAFEPPTEAELDALKKTEAYRNLHQKLKLILAQEKTAAGLQINTTA